MLGEAEASRFLASYELDRSYGLRINTLKVNSGSAMLEELIKTFKLTPVPWCASGYYYPEQQRPGRSVLHTAGLYYIQEPSAMSAAELLDPKPGQTVLDLAAAPGGKTTQIAAKMQGEGLLVSNEIHPARAKILAENVERMGIRNAIVTQATPDALSKRFPLAFDRIMLDAPCSGEGMFRKDEKAIMEWSLDAVESCAARQQDILREAVRMLKPGGRLAYSTCTFNRLENEGNMEWLQSEYPEMELLESRRFWPHLEAGEGHFVALLQKKAISETDTHSGGLQTRPADKSGKKNKHPKGRSEDTLNKTACISWMKEFAPGFSLHPEEITLFGDALYMLPQSVELTISADQLDGLKLPRPGLKLGSVRKGRFEPDHALAMALASRQAANVVRLNEEVDPRVEAYLRGETFAVPEDLQGWTLVTIGEFPLGWGKASSGQLKNHLPKGLRLMGLGGI